MSQSRLTGIAIGALLLSSTLSGNAGAQAGVPKGSGVYGEIPSPGPGDWWFDPLTAQLDTNAKHSAGETFRIFVINVNPFYFAYQVNAVATALPEASPGDFFNFVLGLTLPTQPVPSTPAVPAGSNRTGELLSAYLSGQSVTGCSKSTTAILATASQDAFRIGALDSTIRSQLSAIQDSSQTKDREYRQKYRELIFSPTQPAEKVRGAALGAFHLFNKYSDALSTSIDLTTREMASFAPLTVGFSTVTTDASRAEPGCAAAASSAALAKGYISDTVAFHTNIAAVTVKRDSAVGAAAALGIARDPMRFVYIHTVGGVNKPSTLDITISRTRVGVDKPTPDVLYSNSFNVGGTRRYSINVGVAFAGLGTPDYAVGKRFAQPPDGRSGDTVVNVVTLTDASTSRVVPVLTFATQLPSTDWMSQHYLGDVNFVLGTGVRKTTSDTDLQYLTGLGVGLLEHRLMFTAGVLGARQKRLASQLGVGDVLPSGVTAVPTQSEFHWKFGAAITYRLY